ncbi:MAG: methyltransferase domain-containing protein, partial [Candidatus Aegiribacteria sp.]|nr:methyltransferase domain-containing protein [Candidatus Aegiribacteria sp.]
GGISMQSSALDYLRCPECQEHLVINNTITRNGDIRSGTMECTGCSNQYPVIMGRPALLPDAAVNIWQAPLDEALGVLPGTPVNGPFSLNRLKELGIDRAIENLRNRSTNSESIKSDPNAVTKELLGKARYRVSGEWFKHCGRSERLLVFPAEGGSNLDIFKEFMNTVQRTDPEDLIDLLSGGGYGVTHQAFQNRELRRIAAVQRDLNCLWSMQYRFKHIGRSSISEAIGGDVRRLPIASESFDTAMTLHGLVELHGISGFLKEAYRVLRQGGYYVALYSEDPVTCDILPLSDLRRFALAADLYAGHEQFTDAAKGIGFSVISTKTLEGMRAKKRITVFRRM